MAVDSSGAVYVGLYSSHVNKYVPSANPVTNADYASSLEGLSSVCNVAADSAGNAYSVQWSSGPVTRYEPSQFGSPFPTGSLVDAAGSTLAVDPSNDELYVDEQNRIAQFGPHGEPFQAPVTTFARSGPGAIEGSLGIAVSGLNSEIYASNGKGAISIFGPTTVEYIPPVQEEYATDVTSSSATLGAVLRPEGNDTTYHFEYGLTTGYGSSTPEGDAGSGTSGVSVLIHLQGLSANTVYHYRVVATNSEGTMNGPDQTFTTQPAGRGLTLLDNRQWELVSPPSKHGAGIRQIAETTLIQAADDGHAITYIVNSPTELEPEGNAIVQVFSALGAGVWSSKDIATPHSAAVGPYANGGEYRFFSPDLSLALVEQQGPFTPLSADATEDTEYVRRNAECEVSIDTCYTALATAANTPPGTKFGDRGGTKPATGSANFVGATSDLTHVILSSTVPLTATPGDEGGLYEWVGGQLQLVSILPGDEGGMPLNDSSLGYNSSSGSDNIRNAISDDGSRVFWSSKAGNLYLRDTSKQETIHVGSGHARFQLASVDGSRVFFANNEGRLDVCDVVESGGKLACDTTTLASGLLGGVLGASEDGSYVYFVANSSLAPAAVTGTCTELGSSPSETCNLYVIHQGTTGWETPELIGVVSAADRPDWAGTPVALTCRL